jgi:hypothetical protein
MVETNSLEESIDRVDFGVLPPQYMSNVFDNDNDSWAQILPNYGDLPNAIYHEEYIKTKLIAIGHPTKYSLFMIGDWVSKLNPKLLAPSLFNCPSTGTRSTGLLPNILYMRRSESILRSMLNSQLASTAVPSNETNLWKILFERS